MSLFEDKHIINITVTTTEDEFNLFGLPIREDPEHVITINMDILTMAEELEHYFNAIAQHDIVIILRLTGVRFNIENATTLKQLLIDATSLMRLQILFGDISDEEVKIIADGLRENKTLRYFEFYNKSISVSVLAYLSEATNHIETRLFYNDLFPKYYKQIRDFNFIQPCSILINIDQYRNKSIFATKVLENLIINNNLTDIYLFELNRSNMYPHIQYKYRGRINESIIDQIKRIPKSDNITTTIIFDNQFDFTGLMKQQIISLFLYARHNNIAIITTTAAINAVPEILRDKFHYYLITKGITKYETSHLRKILPNITYNYINNLDYYECLIIEK